MNAIEILEDRKLTIGHARLGRRGAARGSIRQQVHDGDTIIVEAEGNLGVRLLGIDTPEVSFSFPGDDRFVPLSDPRWRGLFHNPWDDRFGPFPQPIPEGLKAHLTARCGETSAANHFRHAQAAAAALKQELERDRDAMGWDDEGFRFFLAFAYEVMDGYGRFLCFANREQPHPEQPAPRPLSYNERLLALGRASAYFVWPNINPFRRADNILDAVLRPGTARTVAAEDLSLRRARESVQRARERHLGVFDAMEPLQLEPFEVRFLARRELPGRWVIDLARNDDLLLHPLNYYTVPHPEDRLFIPAEFVPLFAERGWRRQPHPAADAD